MINIYSNLCYENGGIISGRTKLFIEAFRDDGFIEKSKSGTRLTPENSGTMFIVDDWLIPQLDKLLFIDGKLVVKDGETIEEPIKSEKELQREKLLRQLAELDATENEE